MTRKSAFFLSIISLTSLWSASSDPKMLSPNFEGLYSLNVVCLGSFARSKCVELASKSLSLVVLNHESGATVGIMDSQTKKSVYTFVADKLENAGTELTGKSLPQAASPLSELLLEFTKGSGEVTGWLRDPQFKQDVKLKGIQKFSPGSLELADIGLLNPHPKYIAGAYSGSVNFRKGTLFVRVDTPGTGLLATWVDEAGIRMDFRKCILALDKGVVSFINDDLPSGSYLKWSLQLLKPVDEAPTFLNGTGFATYLPGSFSIQLNRVSTNR